MLWLNYILSCADFMDIIIIILFIRTVKQEQIQLVYGK